MWKQIDNVIKIKLKHGYLFVEEKGAEDEYPGVWVSYSKEDDYKKSELVACVEEDTGTEIDEDEEPRIMGELYMYGYDNPIALMNLSDGEDAMQWW